MAERSASPLLTVDPEGVAWITFADPDRRMNVLDEGVMRRLSEHVAELAKPEMARRVKAVVVYSGKSGSFMAGADIQAISDIHGAADGEEKSRLGQEIFQGLAELRIPTVAAIHGICLGGGVELALACRYRVLSKHPDTRMALPEVQLGLLPGWGGTVRLPKIVGLRAALDMMLTGKQVRSSKARRTGLADAVIPLEGFREAVRRFALEAARGEVGGSRSPGLAGRFLDGSWLGRRIVLSQARKGVMAQTGGQYPAPLKILEVVRRHAGMAEAEALAVEARGFGELAATPEHKNLLHLFHLREGAKKLDRHIADATPRPVDRMAVLGAGVMGGGIAQLAASKDVHVRMKDIQEDAVAGGLRHARSLFEKRVKRRHMTRQEAEQRMGYITGTLDYQGFRAMDLVVEAVVERMEVKQTVLKEVEAVVEEGCVLATNTSSLSVDEMASALEHPERFCGMHFFNPVHRMPLVEVIQGEATTPDALATVYQLALNLGKTPVVCRDGAGFLVNRILGPYLNEAGHLLVQGVSIRDVDRAATAFGMPMGPVRLLDEVGIDVARHAGATLHEAFGARMAPAPLLARLESTDRLGKKNGRGFYLFEGGKEKEVDESVYGDLQLPVPGKDALPRDEIQDRLVLAMINEAARVLEDGIVSSAGDVDLGMIMGTGFPPFRGGLLKYADTRSPRAILERLWELEGRLGVRYDPAPIILELARKNRTFYEAFPTP